MDLHSRQQRDLAFFPHCWQTTTPQMWVYYWQENKTTIAANDPQASQLFVIQVNSKECKACLLAAKKSFHLPVSISLHLPPSRGCLLPFAGSEGFAKTSSSAWDSPAEQIQAEKLLLLEDFHTPPVLCQLTIREMSADVRELWLRWTETWGDWDL